MWPIHMADEIDIHTVRVFTVGLDFLKMSSPYLNIFMPLLTKIGEKPAVFYVHTVQLQRRFYPQKDSRYGKSKSTIAKR